MPFAPHLRLTMSGTIGSNAGSLEGFSMRLNLSNQAGIGRDDQALFDDYVNDCRTFFGSPPAMIWTGTTLREVKLAKIGADGKYLDAPRIALVTQSGGQGGPIPLYPYQIALAVSLVTARRGPTGKGRFYLPTPQIALEANGLLSQQVQSNVAVTCKTFLDALNNAPNLDVNDAEVVVASSKGYNSPVTGVRVGRVPDTIRTRRRKLPESYGPILNLN